MSQAKPRIGVLGAGQLALMLAEAGRGLGVAQTGLRPWSRLT